MIDTSELLDKIIYFIHSKPYAAFAAVLVFICLLLIIIIFVQKRRIKKLKKRMSVLDAVDEIYSEPDYDKKLKKTLDLVRSRIKGSGYHLYLFDEKSSRYRLESVLFSDGQGNSQDSGKIEVGYGRLIAYEKEIYSPPIAFDHALIPEKASVVMDGRFSVLILPILKEIGFISVSVKRSKKYSGNKEIAYLAEKLKRIFLVLVQQKPRHELYVKTDLPMSDSEKISSILDMALLISGASSGIFLGLDNDYCELKAIEGFPLEKQEKIRNNIEQCMDLTELLKENKALRLSSEDPGSVLIPDFLKDNGFSHYFILGMDRGIFVSCYLQKPEDGYFVEYRVRMIKLLMHKINEEHSSYSKDLSYDEYNEELDSIVRRLDDEEPYSVGYSDLMSRYAMILSREIGLDMQIRKSIARAAFLSNIGVLSIPESILRKRGIYDKKEYDIVKKHAEHGAFIAELFTGDVNVGDYIRHHHERVDGKGYPSGLKGDEIPVGSRIIGALQSFLSKSKGRNYRQPLPFDKIIAFIKDEEGQSLDENIVETLIEWFRKKQDKQILKGKPLGSCWEMQCSSEDICQKCPAYMRTDKFCWEFETNNCQAHGNDSCETCFVYTEYLQRMKQEKEDSDVS